MKVFNKDLKQGLRYIKQKKYSRAIRYLEPKVPLFLEDQTFFYLLAIACFHTGDLGGSRFYLERALQVDSSNLDLKLWLAAVQLKKKDTTQAAKIWLNVLEHDPDNQLAKKGLDRLRKLNEPALLKTYIAKGKIKELLPSIGLDPRIFLWSGLSVVVVTTVIVLSTIFLPRWINPVEEAQREELQYIDMELRQHSVTDNQGAFTYLLTRDEVEETYNKVIRYYDNYKDNLAQREVNRLLNSNASGEIKSKVDLLQGYFKKPDYLNFYSDFTFSEAAADPLLYLNCYVLWKGRISNLQVESDSISFVFLVGFEDETQLEGTIEAYVDYAVKVDPEMAVEVLGRLVEGDKGLELKVETIRHIISE